MGMKQKVEALEREVKELRREAKNLEACRNFISELALIPEDAVLLYTLSGMRCSFEFSKAARALMLKLNQ